MSDVQRRELWLLLGSGVITAFGMALLCMALEQSPVRALRGLAVSGGFILAALLMNVGGERRDRLLLPGVSLLCGIGIIALWRVDPVLASKQILWMLLGLVLMTTTYFLLSAVRQLAHYKYVAGIAGLLLLLLTMAFGIEKNGARLWLGIPGLLVFQPTEIAKLLMCVFLAGYVAEKGEMIWEELHGGQGLRRAALAYVGPLLIVALFFLGAFILQRDFGAAALFFGLFVAVAYLATGRLLYPAFGLGLFLLGVGAAYYVFPSSSTIHVRFAAWLNPWADPVGRGYQILNSLFALAAGGITGQGLGRGFPELIPEAATDMIFPVIGEELGFIGATAVLLCYAMLTLRSFSLGLHCRHQFGSLLAACLAIVFGLQTLTIVGGTLRLIPLTGITLPFISYGGTSVVMNFIALGLLLAISREGTRRG